MPQHAYSITNRLTGLAAGAFTWSNGASTNRTHVNDGAMDLRFSVGSVATGVNLIIDLGSALAVDVVATLNSNIGGASSPTLKVEVGTTDDGAFAVPIVAKAASSMRLTPNARPWEGKDHLLAFTSITKRYWRLTWTWNGSYTLQLGEIWLGVLTNLSRAIVYGHGERAPLTTSRARGDAGNTRGHFIAGPHRKKRLPLKDLSESQLDEWLALFNQTYGIRPFLFVNDRNSTASASNAADDQDCIFGRFGSDEVAWSETDFRLHDPDELLIESLRREVGA